MAKTTKNKKANSLNGKCSFLVAVVFEILMIKKNIIKVLRLYEETIHGQRMKLYLQFHDDHLYLHNHDPQAVLVLAPLSINGASHF